MPITRIFVEYGPGNEPIKRHEVTMPSVPEHDFYRQTVSFDAFRNFVGKLCQKTGKLTFHYRDEETIKFDEESKARFVAKYGEPMSEWLTAMELPGVSHVSIWEFYKYIGYNHKKKKLNVN
jgi:hypothetical protein